MAAIVVAGGMLFARWGATSGLPWWVPPALMALRPPDRSRALDDPEAVGSPELLPQLRLLVKALVG